MARDWNEVRYRGDLRDVQELFESYRVEDYLDAFDENRRQHDQGIREQFVKHGIRLTERLSPRIYRLFNEICTSLELESDADVFCLPDQAINAVAVIDVRESGTYSLIGVTAGAMEKLEDKELKFILGHEIGHFLFQHNRLNAILSLDPTNPSATVLPPLGESIFLRWRKKAEISCDRVGMIASGDLHASARALLKATFGLSEKNLNLDIEALLSQVDEIKGRPELMEEAFATHPLLPIRLKALELFAGSEKAKRQGLTTREGALLSDDQLAGEIDQLMLLTRRYPFKPLGQAIMRAIALAGAKLLGADGDVSDEEVKVLIQILHKYFTDEPEHEIVTEFAKINEQLPPLLTRINAEATMEQKLFLLQRLADIALADGALMDEEGSVILEVANAVGVPERQAYGVIVGMAQAVGFRTDIRLNQIAEELRRALQAGFKAERAFQQRLEI